jgi:hypothetical protein
LRRLFQPLAGRGAIRSAVQAIQTEDSEQILGFGVTGRSKGLKLRRGGAELLQPDIRLDAFEWVGRKRGRGSGACNEAGSQ